MSASLANNAPGIELIDNDSDEIPLLGGSTEVGVAGDVDPAVPENEAIEPHLHDLIGDCLVAPDAARGVAG